MKNKSAAWLVAAFLFPLLSSTGNAGQLDSGYPKPISFRKITPELVSEYDGIQMVVSDMHVHTRRNATALFKARYPGRPVLIQINCEGLGLWGSWESVPRQRFEDLGLLDPSLVEKAPALEILSAGIYPLPDFLGYWIYDAGARTLAPIPAGQEIVTLRVNDAAAFLPNDAPVTERELRARVGQDSYMKDVVICPLKESGERDWLNGELASTTAVDLENGTITVRRWRSGRAWQEHPAGTYVAAHSVLTFPYTFLHALDLTPASKDTKFLQPFLPNLTRYCPRDPRTGLNAAEWLARHYAKVKRESYPEADGFVFDVSVGTYYPSARVSKRVDSNNDGEVDNFLFDGVNHWPLGIFDCFRLLREGKKGVFEGLGDEVVLASDSNSNEDQRFFSLLNGGEYEHSMLIQGPFSRFMYSSRIDRLLLWAQRGRKPDVTFIDNKYPDQAHHGGDPAELAGPMTLSAYRLDMASACMGSGYVGKGVGRVTGDADPRLADYPGQKAQRRQYGGPLPLDYDEYMQEVLVFEDDREVVLTMIAPADGEGILQIGLAENRGEIQIRDLELRAGSADVLARRFDNGLVILNGSTFSQAAVRMRDVDPTGNYRRIQGTQDPLYNNGEVVGETVAISPQDAAFLVKQPEQP